MAKITLNKASVDIPIFNANGRSLTSRILEVATGGRLDADPNGKVIVRALSDVTLELQDGDRVGLVGHNGAGKSTLLRVLSGVYVPTGGIAIIQGSIGSLIDFSLGINPEASGRENIFLRGALLGLSKTEVKAKFEEIVAFSELGEFIEMPMRTYSSGMQLRLAFAVSTIVRPEILLMDEWLSVVRGLKDDSEIPEGEQRAVEYGVIAEQVEEAGVPELVNYKDGVPFSVPYSKMPVFLLEVCRKQQGLIENLESRISLLEA
jgi:lipopolysaccharide transport system ATP-binding protein